MPDTFAEAFKEVFRRSQPDAEPPITYGDGTEPDDRELDQIIENHKFSAWAANTAYAYGDQVVASGHLYRCVVAGTSGSASPTFPLNFYDQVTDNTVTWEESGLCSSLYDTRSAIYEALELHETKSVEYIGKDENGLADKWRALKERYAPVGVA